MPACVGVWFSKSLAVMLLLHPGAISALFPLFSQTEAFRTDLWQTGFSLFFLLVQFTNVYRYNFGNYDFGDANA